MSTTAYCVGEEISEKQKNSGYFHSLMPDLKVIDRMWFENFIPLSWDAFQELFGVVEPMILKSRSCRVHVILQFPL